MTVTYNRAATALTQSCVHLRRAREELDVSVEVLGRLHGPVRPLGSEAVRLRVAGALEDSVARLKAAELAIREAWPGE